MILARGMFYHLTHCWTSQLDLFGFVCTVQSCQSRCNNIWRNSLWLLSGITGGNKNRKVHSCERFRSSDSKLWNGVASVSFMLMNYFLQIICLWTDLHGVEIKIIKLLGNDLNLLSYHVTMPNETVNNLKL